ncbi:hypothetical protein ACFLYD_05685 [Chloroflexota bacterium]
MVDQERLEILKMLEAGQIDAEEAASLLSALPLPDADASAAVPETTTEPPEQRKDNWARFWIYPFMAGGLVLFVALLVMGLLYAAGAARGWLVVCGWLPLILGLGIVLLAWWSRNATWLHLRIHEGEKQQIAFSVPLPLTLAAWGLRIAQPFVPQLKETGVDDLIIALRDSDPREEPISIDVQDDEDGERVQIYIG